MGGLTNEISRKNADNRGRRYCGVAEQVTRDASEPSRNQRHEPCHGYADYLSKLHFPVMSMGNSLKNPSIQPGPAGKEDPDGRDENSPEPSNPHVKEGSAKCQDTDHEGKSEREKQPGEFSVDRP